MEKTKIENNDRTGCHKLLILCKTRYLKINIIKNTDYIVKYHLKDGTFLGYHRSTFCQLTDNRDLVKRYYNNVPVKQITEIEKNLKKVMKAEEGDGSIFGALAIGPKEDHWKDILYDDVTISYEYFDGSERKQSYVFIQRLKK